MYNRFETDFKFILENLSIDEQSQVNHDQANEIILNMGFLNEKVSQSEQQLISELLKYISPKGETVKVSNLKVFLCAIMNFNYPWMKPAVVETENEEESEKKKYRVDKDNLGVFNEGAYELRDEEIQWISKLFCLLHANRQDSTLNNKKITHLQKTLASR